MRYSFIFFIAKMVDRGEPHSLLPEVFEFDDRHTSHRSESTSETRYPMSPDAEGDMLVEERSLDVGGGGLR